MILSFRHTVVDRNIRTDNRHANRLSKTIAARQKSSRLVFNLERAQKDRKHAVDDGFSPAILPALLREGARFWAKADNKIQVIPPEVTHLPVSQTVYKN